MRNGSTGALPAVAQTSLAVNRRGVPAGPELNAFISANFRSVWTLELLMYLKENCSAFCRVDALVQALRASDAIIAKGVDSLLAAGLVVTEEGGQVRYSPATAELERLIEQTQAVYAAKPDSIRRLIVSSASPGLSEFADSFRLRRD